MCLSFQKMESLNSQSTTPIVEIPYDNSGASAGTIDMYTSPRVSKKKLAKIAGLIQIACGVVSIICGIVILCVPELKLADSSFNVLYMIACGRPVYYASGLFSLATVRRENNRCWAVGCMVISIFSSLLGFYQFSISLGTLIIGYCYPDEGGSCDLTKITPYRNFQNEDGSRLNNNSRGSPFDNNVSVAPVANLHDLETSDGQAYPLIPRTELDLIKQIGHGGYSEVYLAKWNNHDVAAKRLHEECRLEAEVLARLDHPNIVKLIGVVDEKFDFFLILELCDGGSLRSYLNDNKDQPLGLTFYDWAKQAARPIKYLKEKKIVHKDIKSPNYLLASCGALKLGDFGLAKNVDITISRATETASYPWMAPELLRDNILSPKYDVFAYGIVLWELWTRKMPFEDVVEPAHLAWRICNDNERPEIPTDCPKSVADLMRWCWETDWKMRPNMEEVLAQLASAEEEAIANLSK